jgi:hypothetical protein
MVEVKVGFVYVLIIIYSVASAGIKIKLHVAERGGKHV